jgi:hypothetical protein
MPGICLIAGHHLNFFGGHRLYFIDGRILNSAMNRLTASRSHVDYSKSQVLSSVKEGSFSTIFK